MGDRRASGRVAPHIAHPTSNVYYYCNYATGTAVRCRVSCTRPDASRYRYSHEPATCGKAVQLLYRVGVQQIDSNHSRAPTLCDTTPDVASIHTSPPIAHGMTHISSPTLIAVRRMGTRWAALQGKPTPDRPEIHTDKDKHTPGEPPFHRSQHRHVQVYTRLHPSLSFIIKLRDP